MYRETKSLGENQMENQIDFEEQGKTKQTQEEFDLDSFSDVAVGDQVKYIRPNLNGKTVKILSVKVYPARDEDETIVAISNPNIKYKKARTLITFDSKNAESVQNREYYSGALQFIQKDGKLSPVKFWKKDSTSQIAQLWELVAKFKNIAPEQLSPKMFLSILNSGIKVELATAKIKFQGRITEKNVISKIIG